MALDSDHRLASRVTCARAARLTLKTTTLDVLIRDVSRTGARLRVGGGPLGIREGSSLSDAIAKVATLLGRSFEATLLADGGGGAVQRTFRPVRIGLRGCSLPDIDVGCTFTPPLTDADATVLGIRLPPLRQPGDPKLPLFARPSPPPAPPAPPAGMPPAPIGVRQSQNPTGRFAHPPRSTVVDPRFPNGR